MFYGLVLARDFRKSKGKEACFRYYSQNIQVPVMYRQGTSKKEMAVPLLDFSFDCIFSAVKQAVRQTDYQAGSQGKLQIYNHIRTHKERRC